MKGIVAEETFCQLVLLLIVFCQLILYLNYRCLVVFGFHSGLPTSPSKILSGIVFLVLPRIQEDHIGSAQLNLFSFSALYVSREDVRDMAHQLPYPFWGDVSLRERMRREHNFELSLYMQRKRKLPCSCLLVDQLQCHLPCCNVVPSPDLNCRLIHTSTFFVSLPKWADPLSHPCCQRAALCIISTYSSTEASWIAWW